MPEIEKYGEKNEQYESMLAIRKKNLKVLKFYCESFELDNRLTINKYGQ